MRELCHVYKHGDGKGFDGMWMPEHNRYNHDEIAAGLASGVMGDMGQMPPALLPIFKYIFKVPEKVYIPIVLA